MADIFISYASKDRPTARRLAEALEARGWSVWWDYRGLRGGQPFDRIIEEEIFKARAVVVVWSQNAIGSDWVRAEASHGLEEKKLAPVRIDSATLPLRFMNIHTIDLSSWTGETEAEPFERLCETLSEYLGPSNKTEQPDRPPEPRSQAEPTDALPSLPKRKPVKTYVLAVLATAGVLMLGVGVVMLGERQEVSPPESPTDATVSKPPASTDDVGAAIQAAYERGDYETALSLARPAARQENAAAQFYLGWMYRQGRGVPQDDAEAVRWFRKAAAQGDANAQNNLGSMYLQGVSVPQDDAGAAQWYRKAAEQDHVLAQNNLGLMYLEGRGVPQDDAEAARWYRKAAEQGFSEAQFNLGVMYHLGRGVAQDDAEAVRWFRKAAEQGHADAQNNLGLMYLEGRGVAQDNAEAVRWYRKAAAQGHADAQANLDQLSAKERR